MNVQPTTSQRCHSETEKNNLEDLFSSVLSQFKKYQPPGSLKFNHLGILLSLKMRILEEKIPPISLSLKFTPNTLVCYGLNKPFLVRSSPSSGISTRQLLTKAWLSQCLYKCILWLDRNIFTRSVPKTFFPWLSSGRRPSGGRRWEKWFIVGVCLRWLLTCSEIHCWLSLGATIDCSSPAPSPWHPMPASAAYSK